jgi:hypothetical protein
MCALKLLSDAVPRVADKTFKRKYIALGRIVTHWREIMGERLADIAQPQKIHYRKAKRKDQKPNATLEIVTSSANASLLIMQKGVLLEKINHIFGEQWITDIKFVHTPANAPLKKTKPKPTLSEDDKNNLSEMLETIDDPAIKERLISMGEAFLTDLKK